MSIEGFGGMRKLAPTRHEWRTPLGKLLRLEVDAQGEIWLIRDGSRGKLLGVEYQLAHELVRKAGELETTGASKGSRP